MEKQDILARLREHEAALKALDVVTPEKEADLDASLTEAARGEFATDEEIHAVWAKQVGEGPPHTSVAPAVGEPEELRVEGAQVPFMITRSQKEALRNKGFDDDQISNMTPAQAHRLLGVK
jgi:predicted transcriptional regulator